MHIHNLLLCVAFSLFTPVFSDEDFYQVRACCTFKGPHFEDTEYTIIDIFNKNFMMEYNSTTGNWTGVTHYAIEKANDLNSDTFNKAERALERKLLCVVDPIQTIDTITSVPTIKLKSAKTSNGRHPAMLVCSAYNFYPKQIRLTWMRNEQKVTTDVSYSEAVSDGDWNYQIHSYLEYTPAAGEKISCMVEHRGLSEPMFIDWDPSLPPDEQIQVNIGVCGLILGVVMLSFGFIYYKKKSAAYIAVCQGRTFMPVVSFAAEEAS